jgi:hypothetical protein
MTALTEQKDAALAVRWAREGVAYNSSDATHALLADMLYAAKEYKDAVDEYRLAIAGRPDDPSLKRGLDRARKKMASGEKPARPRAAGGSKKKAKAAAASSGEEAAPAEADDGAGKAAAPAEPSAPAEPAADEQK